MREINVSEVEELVRDLCIKANLYLPEDMESCIECNAKKEQSPVGKNVFADILDNMRVAREETIPDLSGHRHGSYLHDHRTGRAFCRRFSE